MASKQLIVLLDGTWNDADEGPYDTNIVRLRELINKSLSEQPLQAGAEQFASSRVYEASGRSDDRQRLVFYERGVGTGALRDQIFGGVFGHGLGDNVRRAYKFLCSRYAPDDEIFIFGFSRGAYTARSLVGLIGCSGLLQREFCTPELEERVWAYYRTPVNDRSPAVGDSFAEFVHDPARFHIACLGVFDTVGSLGVPMPVFRRKNPDIYSFHNVELGTITKVSLHALAIDEHREPFSATTWIKPMFKAFLPNAHVEQVWFPGVHGSVGGGYVPEDERFRDGARRAALDDIALDWMLRRVVHYFPDFPVDLSRADVWTSPDDSWASAPQQESRTLLYWLFPYVDRSIANYCDKPSVWRRHIPFIFEDRCGPFHRHAEPIAEMAHISALQRYGEFVSVNDRRVRYRPRGLRVVLPFIGGTYGAPSAPAPVLRQIRVVDWSGDILDPEVKADRDRVSELLLGRPFIRADYLAACEALA